MIATDSANFLDVNISFSFLIDRLGREVRRQQRGPITTLEKIVTVVGYSVWPHTNSL
jgi:hypothetical protein